MKNESMMKEELKPKLLQAKSAEEVAGLLKNAGMDESKAGQIWSEISSHRKDKELSRRAGSRIRLRGPGLAHGRLRGHGGAEELVYFQRQLHIA